MSEAGQEAPVEELTVEAAMQRALGLQREGQLDAADEIYGRILEELPDYADAWHFRGLVALERDQPDLALSLIDKAIEVAPDYADAYNNLGNVLFLRARYNAALEAWRRAVELKPDLAEAHFNLGRGFQVKEQVQEALAAFRRGLELMPRHFEAYHRMAALLYAAGQIPQAALVYEEWLSLEPDNDYVSHMLASCTQREIPTRASDSTVRRVFNGFAKDFDKQLAALQYRAPAFVAEGIARLLGAPAGTLEVLDAGCGTGLCAPSLRPYARRLVGVDLSSEMVKRAEDRHLYDELVVEELTAFLAGHPAAYELVASADTLCYFGDLAPPLAAAATALRPGGHLVFTVERATAAPDGYQLNPHGRYSHTDGYVRATLAAAGLTPVLIAAGFLRMESKQAVAGLLVAARR
jgi:predicted TPR repeat methyltransferase